MAAPALPDLLAQLDRALRARDAAQTAVAVAQRALDVAMVAAIQRALPDWFYLAEVAERAAQDAQLHGAITAALGEGWNTKKLSNRFTALRISDLGGYLILQTAQRNGPGFLWKVQPPPCI